MGTPKVILIIGKRDSGKTTTINLLYRELISRGYIQKEAKRPANENLRHDIVVALEWNGKKIGLISNGDAYVHAKESTEWLLGLKVDIIVGVTRSLNRGHSAYRFYQEFKAAGRIKIVHEERTKYATNEAQQNKNSQEVALLLADTLSEIIG
jgi:thymidylate kinase